MGWQTGTTPCQPNPAAKPGAIPETCPSGEEPPEANRHPKQTRLCQPPAAGAGAGGVDEQAGHVAEMVAEARRLREQLRQQNRGPSRGYRARQNSPWRWAIRLVAKPRPTPLTWDFLRIPAH
jgi:hypothetical protein